MNITQHHFSGQNNLFSQIMIELVDSEQETETELNFPEKKPNKLIFTSVCFKFLSFFRANLILVPFPPHRQVLSITGRERFIRTRLIRSSA